MNTFKIHQRRYLGNKAKILPFIRDIIRTEIREFNSFCDIFAGTGVVSHYLNNQNVKIISNELLYNNYISLYCWLSKDGSDKQVVINFLINKYQVCHCEVRSTEAIY